MKHSAIYRMPITTALCLTATVCTAAPWPGFERGMGIGGWLTNYKRFNVLPVDRRMTLTDGDFAHFDSYITEGDVARIAKWGFDHIRLGFDQIVLEEKPGVWRERTFRKIDDFIGWCGKHKVNVVLNLHKAVGNYCDIKEKTELLDDAELQSRFVALWLEIERRYHDFPGLAFELLNEVRDVDPKKWNDLADRTLRAIREKNPTRWVVIGSTCWNSPGKLKDLRIWDDARVVYTYHMYQPFDFTHQRGVLQEGPLYYNRVMPYPTADVERYREAARLRNPKSDGGYRGLSEIGRQYITLRTTLLVGYPGETEKEFQELKNFVREARFDRMGCFPYSPEEGTLAFALGDPVDEETKERRVDELMAI